MAALLPGEWTGPDGRLGGLWLRGRYQDWVRGPFTGESQDHISVYEVTAAPGG